MAPRAGLGEGANARPRATGTRPATATGTFATLPRRRKSRCIVGHGMRAAS
jgi:hypothetical protein